MKLDWELFTELCEKYGVKFSKDYPGIMLEELNGDIHEIQDEDISRLFGFLYKS